MSEPDTGGGAVALATGAAAPSISVHGLTKRCGEVEAVPDEAHDQPLDYVLTDRELIEVKR